LPFDYPAVVPFLGPQFVLVDPTVPTKAIAVLVVLLAALAQFWGVKPDTTCHYQPSSFYYLPRRTSASALDKSMLARFAVAQY
jgi:hypothetical protein